MRQVLALILPFLFVPLALGQSSSLKSTIVLKRRAGLTLEKYLYYYLLVKLPLEQFILEPSSDVAAIKGEVVMDLRLLPIKLQSDLKSTLEKVVAGDYQFPNGIVLDLSQGKISIRDTETDRLNTPFRVDHGSSNPYDAIDVGPSSPGSPWSSCAGYLLH